MVWLHFARMSYPYPTAPHLIGDSPPDYGTSVAPALDTNPPPYNPSMWSRAGGTLRQAGEVIRVIESMYIHYVSISDIS